MINITGKVPIPPDADKHKDRGRKSGGRQEAICKLVVGESFWLKTSMSSMSALRWWAKAKFPDRQFYAEQEGRGVRIWRTK